MNKQQELPFDFNQILKVAKDLSSDMENTEDMGQMLKQVTSTVFSTMEKSGNGLNPESKKQIEMLTGTLSTMAAEQMKETKSSSKPSKIIMEQNSENVYDNYTNMIHEITDDDDIDDIRPYVSDTKIKLDVSLDEMYNGKTKKVAITRDRISPDGKIIKEKRKFEVNILPGMEHRQEIRFNKQGNEKFGHESGDIVITLAQSLHPDFERSGSSLYLEKDISLYESYAVSKGLINVVVRHLDGHDLILKSDGYPLHTKNGMRKIKKYGMPYRKNNKLEYGDLFIRFNLILPDTFEGEDVMKYLEKLFPILPQNKESIHVPNVKHSIEKFKNTKEVQLEEVTPEEIEQLRYYSEDEDDDDDSSE